MFGGMVVDRCFDGFQECFDGVGFAASGFRALLTEARRKVGGHCNLSLVLPDLFKYRKAVLASTL